MLISLLPTSLLWVQQTDHSNRYRHILTTKITTLLRRQHSVMFNELPNWWETGGNQHAKWHVRKGMAQLGSQRGGTSKDQAVGRRGETGGSGPGGEGGRGREDRPDRPGRRSHGGEPHKMPRHEGAGRGVETWRSQAEAGAREFIGNELNCRVCYHEIRVLWSAEGLLPPQTQGPAGGARAENHEQRREG